MSGKNIKAEFNAQESGKDVCSNIQVHFVRRGETVVFDLIATNSQLTDLMDKVEFGNHLTLARDKYTCIPSSNESDNTNTDSSEEDENDYSNSYKPPTVNPQMRLTFIKNHK